MAQTYLQSTFYSFFCQILQFLTFPCLPMFLVKQDLNVVKEWPRHIYKDLFRQ